MSNLPEIEQEFRRSWRIFDPGRYCAYLDRVAHEQRLEMLTRLLSAELEYSFQPPDVQTAEPSLADGGYSEHDERVRPCVRLFVVRFPELTQHNNLMLRLVVLEYALRLQYDRTPPNPSSYISLCGDSSGQLIQLLELAESRLPPRIETDPAGVVSQSDSTVKETQIPRSVTLDPLPMNMGCYMLTRLLGRGGMGYVHAAIDLRSTAQVAVKVMRRDDAWSVFRFIEEFRWLSQLEHPNLVKLYHANSEGDLRYFSMELVEGSTIDDWFRNLPRENEVRWAQLQKVLGQLASAIHYLHDNQVIHCDVKSSNMMITPRRRGVVLDMGLAVGSGQANPQVGTLQYMAPEVVDGAAPTSASDWYSFGVMMYEVMTGSFPPVEVRQPPATDQSCLLEATRLQSGLADCPPNLAAICRSLLSMQPEQRMTGCELVQQLGGRIHPRPRPGHDLLWDGRAQELQQLQNVLERVSRVGRGLITVRGEAGIGKSSLVRHWLEGLDATLYQIVGVRCYHQDQTPHRVLNSLVQELLIVLAATPPERWRPALEQHWEQIGLVFPQVAQLLDERMSKRTPLRERMHRPAPRDECLNALVTWLVAISSTQPLVIAVDDAQWSDHESLYVLSRLLAHEGFRGLLLYVEDGRQSHPALPEADSALHDVETWDIELEPLPHTTCLALLQQWAVQAGCELLPTDAADLAGASGGNPFLLREISRSVLRGERGSAAVCREASTAAHVNVSRRFASLPRNAEIALQYLAVANQPLGFHQLQMVMRIMPHDLQRVLSLLNSQAWVRSRRENPAADVEIAHENFRRVILNGLPPDRFDRRHCRMARVLSSETPPPWPRIADHYWSARRFREAATCYLEAARVAIATGAYHEACLFLERATHRGAARTPSEQRQVLGLKAQCLAATGDCLASAELYESLVEAGAADQRLFECLAGEQWIRAGQVERGLRRLQPVLQLYGVWHDAGDKPAWKLGRWAGPIRTLPASRNAGREDDSSLEIEACLHRLATPLTFLEYKLGSQLIAQLGRLARLRGDRRLRTQAELRAAIVLSFAGGRWRRTAIKRLRMNLKMARHEEADGAGAVGALCMFVWHVQRGKHKQALLHARQALQCYAAREAASQWEQMFLRWGMLASYWVTNQLKALCQATQELQRAASGCDDPMTLFWTHINGTHWAQLLSDRPAAIDESLRVAEQALATQSFQSPHFFLWMTQVDVYLYQQNLEAAWNLFEKNWTRLSDSLLLGTNHYRWWSLSARVRCGLLGARLEPARRGRWLGDARRFAWAMDKLQEPTFTAYGPAFRLAIAAADGTRHPLSEWDAQIARLRRAEHHLMASALQWHSSSAAAPGEAERRQAAVREALLQQGCQRPERMMDAILPLPDALLHS